MSIKYNNILDTVEDEGVQIPSYYGKYLVQSYDEAFEHAKAMDFCGGVRVDGKEHAMMFNNKEEFDKEVEGKQYPLAIVPLV
ncbi:MAG: hypothetical protein LRZ97_00335 [Candidatus Pacebacteria bacterium]|nr:hypothetical protein [Candidatus Paceibacterota bacterium]